MEALIWIAHTLEAALLLAWLVVALGVFGIVRWYLRQPVASQREQEGMFLAHQAALIVAHRRIDAWRDAA